MVSSVLTTVLLSLTVSSLLSSARRHTNHNSIINTNTVRFKQKQEAHGRGSSAYQFPFEDPSLPWSVRVDDLSGRLSVEELVNQTVARYGSKRYTPAIPRLGVRPVQYITECLRGVKGANATAFPQALGLAASFRYGS